MLKEICITPHVFDREHIHKDNGGNDIISLLQTLSISGLVLGLNNKDWAKAVYNKIMLLDEPVKNKLTTILSKLQNRDRITCHPKKDSAFSATTEDDWFDVAKELNGIRDFYRIIATQSYDGKAITAAQLEHMEIPQEFGLTGSTRILKTAVNFQELFLPFLSYAKKATIIDPYFYLHREQCKETLDIVAKCFRERRGKKGIGRIIIHCKWDDKWDEDSIEYVEKYVEKYIEKWKKAIGKISSIYNHSLEIYAWKGMPSSIKLHDRYIITNQSGLVSAAGTDTDVLQQSELSIKKYEELNEVLSQYNENSSPFKLKCKVTISSVEFS
jgi:hypothetical protein